MTESTGCQDSRLDRLAEEIRSLKARLDEVTVRLESMESGQSVRQTAAAQSVAVARRPAAIPREAVLNRAGTGALLPRVATICFVLVFALILRTITDNGMINTRIGSLLGLVYAALLIFWGGRLYSKAHRLAPVFPICGLLLFFSIVFEAHGRFQALPTSWAYLVLFAAGFMVAGIGLRHRAAVTLSLAAFLSTMVAMAIDFPYPIYPLLAIFPLAGNLAAYLAMHKKLCPALRWTTLGLTVLFWTFWAFKLSVPPACDEPNALLLNRAWFFPLLFLFWIFYWLTTIQTIFKAVTNGKQLGFYEGVVPTISAAGAFFAAWIVVGTWYNSSSIAVLGGVTVGLALVHFGAAAWLASHKWQGAPGSNIFAFAGSVLLALGMIALTAKDLLWAFPVWSMTALGLAYLSGRWQSGGVRFTSYLLQIAACFGILLSGTVSSRIISPVASAVVVALLAAMSFIHYQWCRTHKPHKVNSAYFSWLDRQDYSAVALLLAGLVSSFLLMRMGLYELLSHTVADPDNYFKGGQTVLINLGTVLLLLLASRRHSLEIVLVAVAVGLLGMFKALILDMFGIKGIPLVMSVFSFGIVAAVGSVISTRWQQQGKKIL